jgi:hypothetical protein
MVYGKPGQPQIRLSAKNLSRQMTFSVICKATHQAEPCIRLRDN